MSKRIKTTMAIALIALAVSAGTQTTQAQEQENFVWITNTDGITWKEIMAGNNTHLHFRDYLTIRPTIAQIVVPEHARIHIIEVDGCTNLTNLIYRPSSPKYSYGQDFREASLLTIVGNHQTGLRTIPTQPHMQRRTQITVRTSDNNSNPVFYSWILNLKWTTNWQAGEPPNLEIITRHNNGRQEIQVVWREGILQIADAVSGEWKDYTGVSPYRFPLASAKDMQFFRIKPEEEEAPNEESR